MSMILEALSRAEQERRTENGNILDPARYVGSSSVKEERLKKWILLALLVNLVLGGLLLAGFFWKGQSAGNTQSGEPGVAAIQQKAVAAIDQTNRQAPEFMEADRPSLVNDNSKILAVQTDSIQSDRASLSAQPSLSLLEEAKVTKQGKQKSIAKPGVSRVAKKTPPVRYSAQPLSGSSPKTFVPPQPVVSQTTAGTGTGEVRLFSDLSASEQSRLSQYEINVHVYDSNAQNRFVLINMTKYKEGDRLPAGGPTVAAITPEGVIMETGSGRALLERK